MRSRLRPTLSPRSRLIAWRRRKNLSSSPSLKRSRPNPATKIQPATLRLRYERAQDHETEESREGDCAQERVVREQECQAQSCESSIRQRRRTDDFEATE